jgi:hypothetical protein
MRGYMRGPDDRPASREGCELLSALFAHVGEAEAGEVEGRAAVGRAVQRLEHMRACERRRRRGRRGRHGALEQMKRPRAGGRARRGP